MKLVTKKYNNLFDDFFSPYTFGRTLNSSFMKTDISKRKGNYVFDIDVPGYKKDDIKVSLEDGYLNVWVDAGRDNENCSEEECKWLSKERFSGEYSRSFYVGCTKDTKANATYHNGVLTVVIPEDCSKPEANTKYIEIQ